MFALVTALKQSQQNKNQNLTNMAYNDVQNKYNYGKYNQQNIQSKVQTNTQKLAALEKELLNDDISDYNNINLRIDTEMKKANEDDNSLPSVMKAFERSMGKNTKYIFSKSRFFEGISFNDTKTKEILYEYYRLNVMMQMILSVISMTSGIIALEIQKEYDNGNLKSPTNSIFPDYFPVTFSLIVCTASTLFLLITIIADHIYYFRIEMQHIKISDDILRSQPLEVLELICFLIICIFHPNLLFNSMSYTLHNEKYNIPVTYTWNSTWMAISMCKMWFPIKYYLISPGSIINRANKIILYRKPHFAHTNCHPS